MADEEKIIIDLSINPAGASEAINETGDQVDNLKDKASKVSFTNFSKSIREANNEAQRLALSGDTTSEAYLNAVKRVAQLKDEFNDYKKLVQAFNPDNIFQGVIQLGTGVTQAFAGVQGALALVGVEGEDLQKTLVKVQGALALVQGIESISNLKKGFVNLTNVVAGYLPRVTAVTTATQGLALAEGEAAVAGKVLNTTLASSIIGVAVVAIGFLIGALIASASATKKATEELEKYIDVQEKLTASVNRDINEEERLLISRAKARGASEKEITDIQISESQKRVNNQETEINNLIGKRDKLAKDDIEKNSKQVDDLNATITQRQILLTKEQNNKEIIQNEGNAKELSRTKEQNKKLIDEEISKNKKLIDERNKLITELNKEIQDIDVFAGALEELNENFSLLSMGAKRSVADSAVAINKINQEAAEQTKKILDGQKAAQELGNTSQIKSAKELASELSNVEKVKNFKIAEEKKKVDETLLEDTLKTSNQQLDSINNVSLELDTALTDLLAKGIITQKQFRDETLKNHIQLVDDQIDINKSSIIITTKFGFQFIDKVKEFQNEQVDLEKRKGGLILEQQQNNQSDQLEFLDEFIKSRENIANRPLTIDGPSFNDRAEALRSALLNLQEARDKDLISQEEYNAKSIELNDQLAQNTENKFNTITGILTSVGDIIGNISQIAKQDTDLQKGLALAQIAISTGVAIAKAIEASTKFASSTGGNPAIYIATLATYIASITANIANASRILKSADTSGKSTSSSGGSQSISVPAPVINSSIIQGRTDATTGIGTNPQNPIRAFIVDSDLQSQSQRNAFLRKTSRIGG